LPSWVKARFWMSTHDRRSGRRERQGS
jgi:hypothetical protein